MQPAIMAQGARTGSLGGVSQPVRPVHPMNFETVSDAAPRAKLAPATVNVRIRLSALWTATLLCYLYGDYFELYVPGRLSGML